MGLLPDWAEKALPFLLPGSLGGVATGLGDLTDTVRRVTLSPQIEDEVVVEVVGQPGANKQQLYYLALAAANGMVRRIGDLGGEKPMSPGFGMLMIEYDAASDWVRCSIKYRWSTLSVNVTKPAPLGGTTFFDGLAVYRGPQCNVVGNTFDFVNRDAPAVPSSVATGAPQLPFRGDTILTSCPTVIAPSPDAMRQFPVPDSPLINAAGKVPIPSPNPKPPGDNRSMGVVFTATPSLAKSDAPGSCCDKITALIPMVFAALSGAATTDDMTYPVPTGPTAPVPRGVVPGG